MRRKFRRAIKTFVVGVTVFLMTFDSATAFHLFGGFRGGMRSCGWYCGPSYSSSWGGCSSCGSCGSSQVVYSGGCGGCGGGCSDCGGGCSGCQSSSSDGGAAVEHAAPAGIYPQSAPQQPATVNKMTEPTLAPQLPNDSMMQRPAGGDTESMRSMPGTRTTEPSMPRTTTPRTMPADNDMFGPAGGGTTTPEKSGGTTPPTTTPFDSMPAGRGATPSTTTPSTSTPSTPTPNTTTPATTPGGFEDLFPTTPAGGGSTPAGGATPAGGTTPPGGATETKPATGGLDDLFPTGGTTTPAVGGATTPAGGEATPDPFKSASVLREDGGLASDQNREWLDNTGHYTTRARLVSFLDGHVRLLKENGRTTTVPLNRLCQNDLEFVNRQASAQRAAQVADGNQSEVEVGTPLAAN